MTGAQHTMFEACSLHGTMHTVYYFNASYFMTVKVFVTLTLLVNVIDSLKP
jgi:hypothetical protein